VKEPLKPYKVPSLPWEDIAIDFMYLQNTNYLVCTDYHSKFIEIKKLNSKTAEPVLTALKQIFRTHGIPRRLHSDNGPPFDSKQFAQFIKTYDMEHVTSSPKYPKSNGMVEKAIGIMKSILYKVIKGGGDPNLAVLEYNTTPKLNMSSPAEMLMGRVLRTILPQRSSLLKPKFPIKDTMKKLKYKQAKQKEYYDRTAVQLPPFTTNQPVFVQMGHRDWTPGTVVKKLETPRSYLVKTANGSELRRNRVHLRPNQTTSSPETIDTQMTPKPSNDEGDKEIENKQTESSLKQTVPSTLPNNTSTPKRIEREKRIVKRPIRFQDYV
jgi:hypothetical protein